MTDSDWKKSCDEAIHIVEMAYGLKYNAGEKTALKETLGRHIRQPLRLVKIAKLIPDSFKLFKERLPTPEFWIRIHKENSYVAPNTFTHNCHKCDDSGWIQYQIERMGILYTEVALCSCEKGKYRSFGFTKKRQVFENYPGVTTAIEDGRIKFDLGRAIVVKSGQLVRFKVTVETEPEMEPEPEEPEIEDIRDTITQDEIPF